MYTFTPFTTNKNLVRNPLICGFNLYPPPPLLLRGCLLQNDNRYGCLLQNCFEVAPYLKAATNHALVSSRMNRLSLRKTVEKRVSLILVTLSSRSDSDFERSNVSLKDNKLDGVDPNSNDLRLLRSKEPRKNYMVFCRLDLPNRLFRQSRAVP